MSINYILTGPVKTGKSSGLFEWVRNRKDVAGILSPLIKGKKHLYSISNKRTRCLETTTKNAVSVGRYFFDKDVFRWAQKQLLDDLSLPVKYLVVDEIGYLELKGQGLEPTLSKIFEATSKREDISLLLVVRESLVKQIIEKYNIYNKKIISSINELV